jgi:hypothetical protein
MSVVTACYLYRHLGFCADLFGGSSVDSLMITARVGAWLEEVGRVIRKCQERAIDDHERRAFMDTVGEAFSKYRMVVYSKGPGARTTVRMEEIVDLLGRAQELVGATIKANRRPDSLYHAYNILHLGDDTASISRLPLMLEGQVAALSSGLLSPEESLALLRALRASSLYREDQHTYVLYPVRDLQAYLEKNIVPDSVLDRSPALAAIVKAGDEGILMRDADGQLRFHPDFHNAEALRTRLEKDFPEAEARALLDAYEEVFNHKAFTGRSGTMYGYEGIGCIYWHMVAKLLLAAQEVFERAASAGASREVVMELKDIYLETRSGLGFMKEPDEFGAFPLDPYSHTPGFGGAKQPGMTGQVKEEIIMRWGELGVQVHDGKVTFNPELLCSREFLTQPATFSYIDVNGNRQSISLEAGSLAFTFCQVPVVYTEGDVKHTVIGKADGGELRVDGGTIPETIAAEVFGRTGRVERITVHLCLLRQ